MFIIDKGLIAIPQEHTPGGLLSKLEYRDIGTHYVFKHTEVSTALIRSFLPDCPGPFLENHRWLGNYTPMDHQVKAAQHMVYRFRGFNWLDIGTGKTYTTINAIDYVMKHHGVERVLIATPKSTIRAVWEREMFHTMPGADLGVIIGSRTIKHQTIKEKHAINIINHDGLRVLSNELLAADQKWDLIVIDEQTAFKTWGTARTKALRELLKKNHCRLWMLSGEPMPQGVMDIYTPGRMVCGDSFPKSATRFKDLTMRQVTKFKWVPKHDAIQTITNMLGNSVYRVSRDECIDLPPTTYQNIEVDATKEQRRIEKELLQEAVADIDDGIIVAANEAVHMIRLLQVACGAVVKVSQDETKETVSVDCTPKLEALDDIITSTDGPVIVFCPYTAPLDMLEEHLKDVEYRRVDGSTTDSDRLGAFDAVQEGTVKVLLANPRAMAHGITLTRSNTIVWWGLPFSNETYGQANGRIIRKGQARNTHIMHLISMDVERKVAKALKENSKLQGLLLELV